MYAELEFPRSLWSARDAVIEATFQRRRATMAEKALKDWLLDDSGFLSDDGYSAFTRLSIDPVGVICSLAFENRDLRDYLDLEKSEKITDHHRVSYARLIMQNALDDDFSATFVDVRSISDGADRTALIGFTSSSMGQSGISFEWVGAFCDQIKFFEHLEANGFALHLFSSSAKHFDDYSDVELIGLIKRSKSKI